MNQATQTQSSPPPSNPSQTGTANGDQNARKLLWAGFMAILAAGMGFSIRGGILGDWGTQFGFTQTELGQITGGGLVGFGVIILLGALIADAIGYGKLMIFAFVMHFLSAIVTLAATPIYKSTGNKEAAYWCLYIGMFMFAIGNGTAEAVVNPLVATLFPKNKTHYLNILHAGWPAGLVLGGLASFFMVGKVRWEIQMTLFMVPVVLYGLMCIGRRFPKSEASVHGVSFGEMLAEFAAPILLLLLFIHALLGYVELGTDSWISNITGNILASREQGLLLFVYTSSLMFALRFFAGPIVEKISPLGLLFVGATCGAIGLTLLGHVTTGLLVVVAASIYGVGKTFLWPTMLAVVSERFPKGGAITIGAMGGIGMLSAGLLGGPGIGYNQDFFASRALQEKSPELYDQFKSPTKNRFLFFPEIQGLDGSKVGAVRGKAPETRTPEENKVHDADLHGGRMALRVTAAIPATMAVCYLFLILYFRAKGGYKQVHIEGSGHQAHEVA
jgi:MFS family permease